MTDIVTSCSFEYRWKEDLYSKPHLVQNPPTLHIRTCVCVRMSDCSSRESISVRIFMTSPTTVYTPKRHHPTSPSCLSLCVSVLPRNSLRRVCKTTSCVRAG